MGGRHPEERDPVLVADEAQVEFVLLHELGDAVPAQVVPDVGSVFFCIYAFEGNDCTLSCVLHTVYLCRDPGITVPIMNL